MGGSFDYTDKKGLMDGQVETSIPAVRRNESRYVTKQWSYQPNSMQEICPSMGTTEPQRVGA